VDAVLQGMHSGQVARVIDGDANKHPDIARGQAHNSGPCRCLTDVVVSHNPQSEVPFARVSRANQGDCAGRGIHEMEGPVTCRNL